MITVVDNCNLELDLVSFLCGCVCGCGWLSFKEHGIDMAAMYGFCATVDKSLKEVCLILYQGADSNKAIIKSCKVPLSYIYIYIYIFMLINQTWCEMC